MEKTTGFPQCATCSRQRRVTSNSSRRGRGDRDGLGNRAACHLAHEAVVRRRQRAVGADRQARAHAGDRGGTTGVTQVARLQPLGDAGNVGLFVQYDHAPVAVRPYIVSDTGTVDW